MPDMDDVKTPEQEALPDEWFETADQLTRRERKQRVFHLIYGMTGEHCPNTQAMRDRISAYVNYGQPEPELDHIYNPSGTGLHEMVEAMNSVDPEYMRTGKPTIGDLSKFAIHDPEQDGTWDNWNARTEAGELPNPRVEMREYEPPISTDKMAEVNQGQPKTPEEMAEQLGVPIAEVGDVLQAQIEYYMRASQEMLNRFVPPKMNRAQRRAQAKARRRRGR